MTAELTVFILVLFALLALGVEDWVDYRRWQRENRERSVGKAAIVAAEREGRIIEP